MSYDRREKIKSLLNEKNAVYLKELEALFPNLSSMTLRRDIEYFVREGLAVKFRGGAKASAKDTVIREPNYSYRATKNVDAKSKIAQKALSFIETGRSVYLDSGTTIMSLADLLPDIDLSILTSAPNIALEVLKNYKPTVNLVGGQINRDNLTVTGSQALNYIKNINIDIAFFAPSGYSTNGGFTCGNYSECEIKRTIVKKANKIIMLMDSSKIDKNLPFTFATFKDIDVLITDKPLSESIQKSAAKANIEIIYTD